MERLLVVVVVAFTLFAVMVAIGVFMIIVVAFTFFSIMIAVSVFVIVIMSFAMIMIAVRMIMVVRLYFATNRRAFGQAAFSAFRVAFIAAFVCTFLKTTLFAVGTTFARLDTGAAKSSSLLHAALVTLLAGAAIIAASAASAFATQVGIQRDVGGASIRRSLFCCGAGLSFAPGKKTT